jgi:AcrR family transcriptional regulator
VSSAQTESGRETPAAQVARRERILDAAVELASSGGYDAVQMREVAERAEVALGTLYRYFPSKTHLLISSLGRTFSQLQDSAQAAGNTGTPEERVYRVVAHITRFLAKNRRLSGAMVRALMTAEADAAQDVEAVDDVLVGFLAAATHAPGEVASDRDTLNAHIIGKVWLIDVVTFLSGRMTVSQVLEDLEETIALVMRD